MYVHMYFVNVCVCVRRMCSWQRRGHDVYVYVNIRSNYTYVHVNIHDMPHMPPLLQKSMALLQKSMALLQKSPIKETIFCTRDL